MARVPAAAALVSLFLLTPALPARDLATGTPVPQLAVFDRLLVNLLAKYHVPGGALAVTRDGRLVLARGYGRADVERTQAVQPASPFRIASVSKPITTVAVLKLVEDGALDLDAGAFRILDHLVLPEGRTLDARVRAARGR